MIFVIAGGAALLGKKQVSQAMPPAPTAAVQSTKNDVDAVKTAVHEGRQA